MPIKAKSRDPSAQNKSLIQARRLDRHVLSLAASAALAVGLLSHHDAHALALGRLTVQSALGEPLRAEIEIPDINQSEADSLRAVTAPVSVFRAQGVEFNPLLSNVTVALSRRPDGRYVLRLSSSNPVNDPFIDFILEASWASGRIVRDYTMLFDPPATPPAAPTRAQQAEVATPAAPPPAPAVTAAALPPLPPVVTAPAPATRSTAAQRRAAPAPDTAAGPNAGAGQVTVRAGDTASRIAGQVKPAGVSLDQMLVALLGANPDAFIGNNVNRIRAGAVLNVPDAAAATANTPEQATGIIAAQARDFNDFRRRLAGAAPEVGVADAQRSVTGRVQAQVQERKPAAATPDRLTLSKGAVGAASAADRVAQEGRARDTQSRAGELERNIAELDRVRQAAAASPASSAASAAAPTVAVAAPVAAPASAPAPAASAPPATAPAAPAAAVPASPPASRPTVAPAPPPPEPSFVDELMANPLVPAAAGGLVAVLAGLGLWRLRKRRGANKEADSSFLESKLQPDSFFGASGGQRVDTNSNDTNAAGASSLAYSPSQLDAAGDVDPVAEADVYLAYGRDLQAEEILKEALKTNPTRLAIHAKLLEIYAKRKDITAFTAIAADAYRVSGAKGPEWERMAELGREIDPSNPMYQSGSAPSSPAALAPAAGVGAAAAAAARDVDVDLDLDFSAAPTEAPDSEPTLTEPPPATAATAMIEVPDLDLPSEPVAAPEPAAPADMPSLDLDFEAPAPEPMAAAPQAPATPELTGNEIDFSLDLNPPEPTPPPPAPEAPAPAPEANAPGENMIEFDLGSMTLDLDASTPAHAPEPAAAVAPDLDIAPDDPLATKLALAEEFNAIGDSDGARALIEEVLAEASGAVKARAQKMLESLI